MDKISRRIQAALTMRNMKQADLVKLTGIHKSSISTYLSGEYEPKQKNIYKIAKALNVNEAWLMGYDVPMERKEPDAIAGDRLNQTVIEAQKILESLPSDLQEAALAQLKILAEISKKQDNE